MKRMETKQKLDGLFVLLIFALFAGSLLLVLLTGAGSYQRLLERDAKSYDRNTTLQYVAAKLHGADQAGGVTIGSFSNKTNCMADDIETLYLRETLDGSWYETRIYYYDGYIRELLAEENAQFSPEDGTPIFESGGLSFLENHGSIFVTVKAPDGEINSLCTSLRSDEEVGA